LNHNVSNIQTHAYTDSDYRYGSLFGSVVPIGEEE
jgi:hypothetical protein